MLHTERKSVASLLLAEGEWIKSPKIISYDDEHSHAAVTVLERTEALDIRSVKLDAEFSLDDVGNAAVTLANDLDASFFLCDEFKQFGSVHASLANTRLVTTPTFLDPRLS